MDVQWSERLNDKKQSYGVKRPGLQINSLSSQPNVHLTEN